MIHSLQNVYALLFIMRIKALKFQLLGLNLRSINYYNPIFRECLL